MKHCSIGKYVRFNSTETTGRTNIKLAQVIFSTGECYKGTRDDIKTS